ncbi:hypothetical protein OG342_04725 [Streptomyces bobili]|uniref:hypothetical protein n=1 Tax=Streptomyces bobili TaxID=67280 RepID=UPI0022510E1E|nr:hypothetical protein [Streptomyces bobili]MCX5522172.1 hypothetical protein [Streptomyces bobili]
MIVNYTPHPVRIYNSDRPDGIDDLQPGLRLVIEPEDVPARLQVEPLEAYDRDGIPVEVVRYGHAYGLPDESTGVALIVSLPVGLALASTRTDLLVPYSEVRNSAGTVIGCRALAQPA